MREYMYTVHLLIFRFRLTHFYFVYFATDASPLFRFLSHSLSLYRNISFNIFLPCISACLRMYCPCRNGKMVCVRVFFPFFLYSCFVVADDAVVIMIALSLMCSIVHKFASASSNTTSNNITMLKLTLTLTHTTSNQEVSFPISFLMIRFGCCCCCYVELLQYFSLFFLHLARATVKERTRFHQPCEWHSKASYQRIIRYFFHCLPNLPHSQ